MLEGRGNRVGKPDIEGGWGNRRDLAEGVWGSLPAWVPQLSSLHQPRVSGHVVSVPRPGWALKALGGKQEWLGPLSAAPSFCPLQPLTLLWALCS